MASAEEQLSHIVDELHAHRKLLNEIVHAVNALILDVRVTQQTQASLGSAVEQLKATVDLRAKQRDTLTPLPFLAGEFNDSSEGSKK